MGIAFGLVLGAIASATGPAATANVLWEYKTAGPLTKTILGIVALDDGLALLLFAVSLSIASSLVGTDDKPIIDRVIFLFYELFGAGLFGFLFGIILSKIIKIIHKNKQLVLTVSISTILLLIGLTLAFEFDMILGAMVLGITLINVLPKRSKEVFKAIQNFMPPIQILFFVLIGTKLKISSLFTTLIFVVLALVFARTLGKMLGARFGAKLVKAHPSIVKYLPLCLFSQAGVAIGLALLAGKELSGPVGDSIIVVVTAATFLVEIVGSPFLKLAVKKAGEIGLNITKEDLIKQSKVKDVMDVNIPFFKEDLLLNRILKIMSEHPYLYYPVIDKNKKLLGILTIENIKNTYAVSGLHDFLIAYDLLEPVTSKVNKNCQLEEAIEQMNLDQLNYLPVVDDDDQTLIGFIEQRRVNQLFCKEDYET